MSQYPSIPPFIESNDREYHDSGVQSTVAIAGHPLHPLIVTFPLAEPLPRESLSSLVLLEQIWDIGSLAIPFGRGQRSG